MSERQINDQLAPAKCPITGREYWGWIKHPEKGAVPVYGGHYDSYTIPEMQGEPSTPYHERELVCEHYDHDAGTWKDPEIIPLRVVNESHLFKLESEKADLLAALNIIADRIAGIHIDRDGEYECESCNAAIEIAREYIAKAEGKQNG